MIFLAPFKIRFVTSYKMRGACLFETNLISDFVEQLESRVTAPKASVCANGMTSETKQSIHETLRYSLQKGWCPTMVYDFLKLRLFDLLCLSLSMTRGQYGHHDKAFRCIFL